MLNHVLATVVSGQFWQCVLARRSSRFPLELSETPPQKLQVKHLIVCNHNLRFLTLKYHYISVAYLAGNNTVTFIVMEQEVDSMLLEMLDFNRSKLCTEPNAFNHLDDYKEAVNISVQQF